MEKSIATDEYRLFLSVLKRTRKQAGITQTQLAESIDESQSFISKVERGEIRIDVIQLRTICHALGTDLVSVSKAFERDFKRNRRNH